MSEVSEMGAAILWVVLVMFVFGLIGGVATWAMTKYDKGKRPPRERVRIDATERALLGDDWRDVAPHPRDVIEIGDPEDNVILIFGPADHVRPFVCHGGVTGRMNPDGSITETRWSR